MKKALLLASLITAIGLTSCGGTRVYYGEYSEQASGYTYTTKVNVTTEAGLISKVEFVEGSNHHTDPSYWTDATKWTAIEDEILNSFVGLSVKEVKNSKENTFYDNVAGATLTSTRVYKAVVAALNN